MASTYFPTKAACELRHDPATGNWSLVFRNPGPGQFDPKQRYKNLEAFIQRQTRQAFESTCCVWSQQFSGGRRQEKHALFGLRWSTDGKQVEVTYDNWHGSDWEVMAVRTDYAQVVPSKDCPLLGEDTFLAEAGAGVHDLIIEDATEAHEPLGVMGAKRTQLVLTAMLYRLTGSIKGFPVLDESKVGKPLGKESFVRHVAFFRNHRREAGGSQEHPHSQCIGIPIIPTNVSAELEHARKRLDQPPRQCVYCEVIEAELALRDRDRSQSRILFETEHFLAVVPFAPRHPFEVWIIPKHHHSCFGAIMTDPSDSPGKPTELEDLAALLTEVLCRLYVVLDDPGYNLVVHTQPTPPVDASSKWSFYHWHIQVQPRGLVTQAGFERSTGTASLPTSPEEMADILRRWGALHETKDSPGSLEWYIEKARMEVAGDSSVKGSARQLCNIVKILAPMAGQIVGFVHARAVLKRLEKEQPHLLLSHHQQRLPDETKQLLQPEEHAGGESGPHFRCCPATGRWVLFTTTSRRKTVARLKKEREEETRRRVDNRKMKLQQKATFLKSLGYDPAESNPAAGEARPQAEVVYAFVRNLLARGAAEVSPVAAVSWLDRALLDALQKRQPVANIGPSSSSERKDIPETAQVHVTQLKARPALELDAISRIACSVDDLANALRSEWNITQLKMERAIQQVRQLEAVMESWRKVMKEVSDPKHSDAISRAAECQSAVAASQLLLADLSGKSEDNESGSAKPEIQASVEVQLSKLRDVVKTLHAESRLLETAIGQTKEFVQTNSSDTEGCQFCDEEWQHLNRKIEETTCLQCYVIANSNPLFSDYALADGAWPPIGGTGPFRLIEGFGACEVVVVEDKKHGEEDPSSHDNPPCQVVLSNMLHVVARRIFQLRASGAKFIRHIAVFSNHGPDAGAGTSHPVWQIVGAPIVPTVIERELDHFRAYSHTYSGRCCCCDMLAAEIREHSQYEDERQETMHGAARARPTHKHRSRVVDWAPRRKMDSVSWNKACFVALCPYASGAPLETWIIPTDHSSIFGERWLDSRGELVPERKEEIDALASLLRRVLKRISEVALDPGYTLVVQQAPFEPSDATGNGGPFHWRIVIEPQKLNIPAGFENLTGIWSNIVLPEESADCLADALSSSGVDDSDAEKT